MEGGASDAKEDAELQNRPSVFCEGLVRDLLFSGVFSHCQPGCVGEDTSALTFQLAQPADNVSSLNLAQILGSQTWVPSLTVGAHIITRNRSYEIL
jgi:hypothetical protein